MYNFIKYHNYSKLNKEKLEELEDYYLKSQLQEGYYTNLKPRKNFYNKVTLGDSMDIDLSLFEVLERRTSFNKGNFSPLKKAELSTVLFHSMTKKYSDKKPYPSAGNIYSIYLYVIVNNVVDIPSGIYLYNPSNHSLEQFKEISDFNITTLSNSIAYPNHVSVALFTSSLYIKSFIKYGERSYRFALLESGHLIQNIELLTTSINGTGHCIGGFYDEFIEKSLDLNELEILTHGYLLYGSNI